MRVEKGVTLEPVAGSPLLTDATGYIAARGAFDCDFIRSLRPRSDTVARSVRNTVDFLIGTNMHAVRLVSLVLIAITGTYSNSVVFRFRKLWGADLGAVAINRRLCQEQPAVGWSLVASQAVTLLAGLMLFIVLFRG